MEDRRLAIYIGNLLRAGVLLSASIVSLGGVLYVLRHHGDRISYRHFVPNDMVLLPPATFYHFIKHTDSSAIIHLGTLILVATPIARVALAGIGFALENDRLYAGISLVVLAILVFSLTYFI